MPTEYTSKIILNAIYNFEFTFWHNTLNFYNCDGYLPSGRWNNKRIIHH